MYGRMDEVLEPLTWVVVVYGERIRNSRDNELETWSIFPLSPYETYAVLPWILMRFSTSAVIFLRIGDVRFSNKKESPSASFAGVESIE